MDKGGDMSGPAANNSSDFVSLKAGQDPHLSLVNVRTGAQAVQVSGWMSRIERSWVGGECVAANALNSRMLEDPSYDTIVKWGDGGESFVVIEVCSHVPVHVAAGPNLP